MLKNRLKENYKNYFRPVIFKDIILNWKIRNKILYYLSLRGAGRTCYQLMQKYFGEFNDAGFLFSKIDEQLELISFIKARGIRIADAKILELGTGWVPFAPLIFSICGAGDVTSIDINNYYIPSLFAQAAGKLFLEKDILVKKLERIMPQSGFSRRLESVFENYNSPGILLNKLNIRLISPIDASATKFQDSMFDIYYSIDTLEHIPGEKIKSIIDESYRIVKPGGVSAHLVDASDHFSYTDPGISRINFLRYSNAEWARYGNNYTFHNRLREADYAGIFMNSDFKKILSHEYEADDNALTDLEKGFPVSDEFKIYDNMELSRLKLKYLLMKE